MMPDESLAKWRRPRQMLPTDSTTDEVNGRIGEDEQPECSSDWRLKYESAFTYAAYNDLDKMGYQVPKRFSKQIGPRYARYSYTETPASLVQSDTEPRALHTVLVEAILIALSICLLLLTLPLSLAFSLKFIRDFEKLVVLRLGRAQKIRGPGATLVLPCIDTYKKVDLRINAFNVPPLQIITVDRGLVELGATVFLRVQEFWVRDPLATVCAVKERNCSTRTLAIVTLYRMVCKKRVIDVISSNGKREISELLQSDLAEFTSAWGIEITKVEISEIKVLKEGENLALSTFGKVLKSEFGARILESITSTAQEFVEQQKQKIEEEEVKDLIEFPDTGRSPADGCHLKVLPEASPSSSSAAAAATPSVISMLSDVDQLLCTLSMVIDECLVAIVGQIYQVNCAGLGNFFIDLKNGTGSCAKGTSSNADVVFGLDKQLLTDIICKRITPMHAYFVGTLQISGPVKAALKLAMLTDRLSCLL